ncbi:pentapeptide repeat-containing protein [Runella sp.]|uniref:pentapeptide repeat-containing protein n=1 Tax=Runella sp. TaxID=1960881 RepID=UPI003D0D8E90
MANPEHLVLLQQGATQWNAWRKHHKHIRPDLQEADLRGLNLQEFNLKEARMKRANLAHCNLTKAKLDNAYLRNADLTDANLTKASLAGVNLRHAILCRANFTEGYLRRADLSYADLTNANMKEAVLEYAQLVDVTLEGTDLTNCKIYGASVWNLMGTPANQSNLIITPQIALRKPIDNESEPIVTVDDLEVAQFVYLLLNNAKIRNVINTMTSKTVLILGRFTPDRKAVLDTIAGELRKHNLLPIIFDFERAQSRDFTETIKILAGLSFFIIADITKPKSVPLELQATVPDYQIPFVPIIQSGEEAFSMFRDLKKYDWVLDLLTYSTSDKLKAGFKEAIIDRAWAKHQELEKSKAVVLETLSIDDFLNKPN